ncbi:MAG: efflux transporter periplasmic adaptor subunit [Desulfotalea sp.]|nr:MAG: efflux transporter periplasmic adaptor subunit [Desulfotalea sp.]
MLKKIMMIGICSLASIAHAAGPPPAKVVLGEVVKQEVATTQSVTGVLYYERVSDISTEVAGLVEEIKVSQGDQVKAGQLLVRLNTEILEQEIVLSKTRIAQSELRIKNKEKNYKRLERLFNSSGVSEKDYDDAYFAYQDAQMEKRAGQDKLAKLVLEQKRSKIRAPFSGVVLSKGVDSGAWVQQGKLLVSIGSSSDLFVRAPIAENMLRFIQVGEKIPVILNAFNKEIEGTLIGIDPVADIKTKNIFLKIKIPAMAIVAQNMSASVLVPSSFKKELSVLSRAAVIKFQGKDFVYTVKEDKAEIMPINIVSYMGQMIATDSPSIVPGAQVVIEGNERLRPGQSVMVVGGK